MSTISNVMLIVILASMMNSCQPDSQKQIDALFTEYNREDGPGASVIVIKGGEVLFKRGYGLANLEEKTLVQTNTNFRLASVTKQFTAMAIIMLIERGKLDFDSQLTEIFPAFPDYGKRITIKHLLNHTSGLIAYEALISDTTTVQVKDRDVLDMMRAQDSTYFEPGLAFRYSNSGYGMLAMVVENVSGQSFASFLKENIFEPLAMDNTLAYEDSVSIIPNRAYGYNDPKTDQTHHGFPEQPESSTASRNETENGFEFSDQSLTSAVLGDGGIYSSVEDLYKWDQALYTEKLIGMEMLSKAFQASELSNGEKLNYGLGWFLDDYRGKRRVYHTGSTRGFRTVLMRFPDDRFTVIILFNRNQANPKEIAERIVDFCLID